MDAETWTLSELAVQVAAVLRGYEAATNGQVRAVPGQRAVRPYPHPGVRRRPGAGAGTRPPPRRSLSLIPVSIDEPQLVAMQ